MPRQYIAILVGLLSACSTVPISHEPSNVPLTQAVHFSSPDGSAAVASPGVYRVERVEPTVLKLIPAEEGKQKAITVQAMPTEHEETLSAPLALSIPYKEDEHHIVLLMPDGKALDAVGTYSGVRSRAAPFPLSIIPLSTKTLTPYTKLLRSLSLSQNSTTGFIPVAGIVSLEAPAPGNGVIVSLSSTGLAQVPSSIIIAGGQTQATFPIQPVAVVNTTSVIISAAAGGITRTAQLTLVSHCPNSGGQPCNNQGMCNPSVGQCSCYIGFNGAACQYGNVSTCNGHGTVDYIGSCTCVQGFTGQYCNIPVQ